MVYDSSVISTSHHFQDSHRRKAENESWSSEVTDVVKSLIHDGASETGDDFSKMSIDDLYDNISLANYHLLPAVERSEELLSDIQKHFL